MTRPARSVLLALVLALLLGVSLGACSSSEPVARPSGSTVPASGSVPSRPPGTDVPLAVVVSPATGLQDGSPVTVTVTADEGSQIFGFEIRLCKGSGTYRNEYDFDPTESGQCVPTPLSPGSDDYQEVAGKAPYAKVETTFRVGVGTSSWTTNRDEPATVTCGPSDPCALVLKLQYPEKFAFRAYPIAYA